MNGNSIPPLAQRTCAQCKSSKKRCDKILPACSRCSRLSIDCVYSDAEKQIGSDAGQDTADARFDEVFRRLQTLENHVFSASQDSEGPTTQERLLAIRAESQGVEKLNPDHFAVNPGKLKPQYLSIILSGSVLRVLKEHSTSIQEIARSYFKFTHQWLPTFSEAKFEKLLPSFNRFEASDAFMLLILAMHCLATPIAEHPPADSLEHSPWYRTCKYHFAQLIALNKPSVELIQAGMLIAVFEYIQNISGRALLTLGICTRLAYGLELDEVVSKQSNRKPGEMSPEDEESVLTWWGLIRLDRYFNMPPLPRPGQPCVPFPSYNDNIAPDLQGPPTSGFSTVDPEVLDYSVFELEAACRLGRVQAFIRGNRHQPVASISDGARSLLKEIQQQIMIMRIRMQQSGSWAGIAVTAGAGLQLQCFFVEKQGSLDSDSLRSLHCYVTQIRDVISQCRTFNGFTDNYLEGIQPTWCSLPFQALRTYIAVQAADKQHTLSPIDITVFWETLQIMAPRYKLAENCLQLLDTA